MQYSDKHSYLLLVSLVLQVSQLLCCGEVDVGLQCLQPQSQILMTLCHILNTAYKYTNYEFLNNTRGKAGGGGRSF